MIGLSQRAPWIVTHWSMPPMLTKLSSMMGADGVAQTAGAFDAGVVCASAANGNSSMAASRWVQQMRMALLRLVVGSRRHAGAEFSP